MAMPKLTINVSMVWDWTLSNLPESSLTYVET